MCRITRERHATHRHRARDPMRDVKLRLPQHVAYGATARQPFEQVRRITHHPPDVIPDVNHENETVTKERRVRSPRIKIGLQPNIAQRPDLRETRAIERRADRVTRRAMSSVRAKHQPVARPLSRLLAVAQFGLHFLTSLCQRHKLDPALDPDALFAERLSEQRLDPRLRKHNHPSPSRQMPKAKRCNRFPVPAERRPDHRDAFRQDPRRNTGGLEQGQRPRIHSQSLRGGARLKSTVNDPAPNTPMS